MLSQVPIFWSNISLDFHVLKAPHKQNFLILNECNPSSLSVDSKLQILPAHYNVFVTPKSIHTMFPRSFTGVLNGEEFEMLDPHIPSEGEQGSALSSR